MTYDGKASARSLAHAALALSHMSPTGLADRAGVDRKTVADFLSGARWPRDKSLSQISEALGLTPDTLGRVGRAELYWDATDEQILLHLKGRPDTIRVEADGDRTVATDADPFATELQRLEELAAHLLERIQALREEHEGDEARHPRRQQGVVRSFAGSGKTASTLHRLQQQEAARRGVSQGRAQRDEQDAAADVSQDPGGIDPA